MEQQTFARQSQNLKFSFLLVGFNIKVQFIVQLLIKTNNAFMSLISNVLQNLALKGDYPLNPASPAALAE
jgi:hypothetical protein